MIMRDTVDGATEVDKMRGHLTRIYAWGNTGFKRPIRNAEIIEKCKICRPSAVTLEFEGMNKFVPSGSVYNPDSF